MKTSSSTSTTRTTNQMAKPATKSATNVAPDNRDWCSGGVGVVVLDELGVCRSLPQLLGFTGRAGGQQPQLTLQVEQLLVGVRLHLETLELLHEGIARQVFVHFGRGDQLPL